MFRTTRILKKIIYCVLALHIIGISFIFLSRQSIKPKHKPLIVRTMTQTIQPKLSNKTPSQSPNPLISSSAKSPSKTKTSSQPQAKPKTPIKAPVKSQAPLKRAHKAPPKPVPPPQAINAKPKPSPKPSKPVPPPQAVTAKPKPSPKPLIDAKTAAALTQALAKSLDTFENAQQKLPTKIQLLPAPIQLQIDHISTGTDPSYTDSMIEYLHNLLHLPEFGEVIIQLTLHQDGRIAKLVVLKSESEENRRYLENHLTDLHFPYFTGSLTHKKEHTFVLTFCNEIN